MAVGTVSSVSGDNWQLIATNTPTSGTSTSFTSLSGYRKFRLIWSALTFGGSATAMLRFNSDSTNSYIGAASGYVASTSEGWSTAAIITGYASTTHYGFIDIEDVDKTFPKKMQGVWDNQDLGVGDVLNGVYIGSSAITSIALLDSSGNTISSGTVYLYGLA
jgi:hypothetical protein